MLCVYSLKPFMDTIMDISGKSMTKLPKKPVPNYKVGDMVKVYQNIGVITKIEGQEYHITLFVGGNFIMDRRTYGLFWDAP